MEDLLPCGLLVLSAEGTVLRANARFADMTGRTPAEVVGRLRLVDLLTPGGRAFHETHLVPLLRLRGHVDEIALDLRHADDSRVPVLINAVRDPRTGQTRVVLFGAASRREYERELLREKERAERSEARATVLSRTLQASLVPPLPPAIPGLDISGAYRPAGDGSEVGGDFYDVFAVGRDDWVVALGDVRGKGVEAAVVTSLARHTLRAAVVQDSTPSEALRVLNDALLRDAGDRFCTVVLARLTRSSDGWTATVSSGGHPLPLLVDTEGKVREFGVPGTLLGVLSDPELQDHREQLAPGDRVLLYTDGITEARHGSEMYGEERLHRLLRTLPAGAQGLAEDVVEAVLDYQGGWSRDDIAIVAWGVPE